MRDALARDPGDDRSAPRDRTTAAADALARGRPSEAIQLLRQAEPGSKRVDAEARLLLARAYFELERDRESGVVVEQLLLDGSLPQATRAFAMALAAHSVTVCSDPERGRQMALEALEAAGPTGDAAGLALFALARAAMYDGDLQGAMRLARRAQRAAAGGSPDVIVEAALQEAFLRMQCDRFRSAEAVVERVAPAIARGSPRLGLSRQFALGAIRFHAGRWDGIERLLDPHPALAAGIELGDDTIAGMAALLAVVLVHRDRVADAQTLLARTMPSLVTGQRPFLLWASLLVAEASGDAPATRTAADRLIASFEQLGSPGGLRIYGPDLIRILVDLGEERRASELTAIVVRRAPTSGVPSVFATAHLLRGIVDRDPDRLRQAATGFRSSGRPLEQAMSLEVLGDLLARAGTPREAINALRGAARLYATLGAWRDERRTAAALRSLGAATGRSGPRSGAILGWTSLSPTERTVAALVADGMTNAEIGERLRISARTVESHVAHALTKLSVRNRAELAATAAREAVPR